MKIELIGGYEKNELETRIQKVATAGKLSRFAGNVFERMKRLADAGIQLNAQIVSVPNINNGEELLRTVNEDRKSVV